MSTFGTMIGRIVAELERSDMGTPANPGIIGQHINDAIAQHAGRNWWFLQGPTNAALTSLTTPGDSYVSEYAGLIQLDSLRITVSGQLSELRPISFDEMEMLHDGNSNTGEPFKYTRWGGRVRLYPTPREAYTLTWSGLFEQPALAAEGDTNVWMTIGEALVRHTARMTLNRDYIRDLDGASACIPAITDAISALDRQHMRRMATRNIRPRM